MAEKVSSTRSTIGRSARSGLIEGGDALRAANKAIRVRALIIDVMDVLNGVLKTRLSIRHDLAAVFEHFTKAFNILVTTRARSKASIDFLEIGSQCS